MSATTETKTVLKGGEWLVKESKPSEAYTPEEFCRRAIDDPRYV